MTLFSDSVKALGLFLGKHKTNKYNKKKYPKPKTWKHKTPNVHPLPSSSSYTRQNCFLTTFLYPHKCQYKAEFITLAFILKPSHFPFFYFIFAYSFHFTEIKIWKQKLKGKISISWKNLSKIISIEIIIFYLYLYFNLIFTRCKILEKHFPFVHYMIKSPMPI